MSQLPSFFVAKPTKEALYRVGIAIDKKIKDQGGVKTLWGNRIGFTTWDNIAISVMEAWEDEAILNESIVNDNEIVVSIRTTPLNKITASGIVEFIKQCGFVNCKYVKSSIDVLIDPITKQKYNNFLVVTSIQPSIPIKVEPNFFKSIINNVNKEYPFGSTYPRPTIPWIEYTQEELSSPEINDLGYKYIIQYKLVYEDMILEKLKESFLERSKICQNYKDIFYIHKFTSKHELDWGLSCVTDWLNMCGFIKFGYEILPENSVIFRAST